MKEFVKLLYHNGDCLNHIYYFFPSLSDEKKKAGVFNGPQIRTLLRDAHFVTTINVIDVRAWTAFCDVIINFLGNKKAGIYEEIAKEQLQSFQSVVCKMSTVI